MGATREYEFINGPETSTLPTVGTPTATEDIVNLGYADSHYVQGKKSVADITALKAITNTGSTARVDNDQVYVKSMKASYVFDSGASDTGNDDTIVTPTAGTGRWFKLSRMINQVQNFTNDTESTDKDTGGAVFDGGVGIEKNLNVGGNATVTGDLTVNGTTTTLNVTTHEIEDPNILVNKGGTQATANAATAGITVDISDGTDAIIGYDSSLTSKFRCGVVGSSSEIITDGFTQNISGAKTFTNDITISNEKKLNFFEATGNGINYISLKAPSAVTTSTIFSLPDGDGLSGQYLQTNGSAQLQWGAGGSGAGETNYITEWNFEDNATTGWVTYADAAGTTPVNGVDGSATTTFAATASSPIRGTYSGLITKDAANRQGEGISYPFTIASVDVNRLLKIQFDFETSANYVANDYTVYVYDVTNSVLITPQNVNIPVGPGTFGTTFAATSSTSYRLILHCASTNASAYTIKLDNIICGPGQLIQGVPVDNWTTWTPTGTWTTGSGAGPGNAAAYYGRYRRVGDSAEYDVLVYCSGTQNTSTLSINLPSDHVVDINKLAEGAANSNPSCGHAVIYDNSGGSGYARIQALVVPNSTTTVTLAAIKTANTEVHYTTQVDQANPITFTTGDKINLHFTVPIVGWSSNVYLGSGADTTVSPLNWTSFTPGTIYGLGTVAATDCRYRRVGDSFEIEYKVTAGNPATSPAAIKVPLPTGYTANTGGSDRLLNGSVGVNYTGGTQAGMFPIVLNSDATYLQVGKNDSASILTPVLGNAIVQTGGIFYLTAIVPIVGITAQDYIGKMLTGFSIANSTTPGLVSAEAQTFGGIKTFPSGIVPAIIDNGFYRNIGSSSQEYIVSGEYSSTIADGATDVSIFRVRPSEACAFTVYMDFIVTHAAASGSSAVAAKSYSVRWGAVRDSAGNYALLAVTNLDASAEYGDATATRGIGTVTFAAVYVSATDFRFRIATIDLTGSSVDVARVAGIARVINTGAALTSASWQ